MGNVALGAAEGPSCWFKDCDNAPAKKCLYCFSGENDLEEEKEVYFCEEHRGYHWGNEHTRLPGARERKSKTDPGQTTL